MLKVLTSIICSAMTLTVFASPELKTVSSLEIEKYMGKWYEIARFDNSFCRRKPC